MLAGLASGVTEAIIVNPFEVIKVRSIFKINANPTKNKTHECHNSGVKTCIFLFF